MSRAATGRIATLSPVAFHGSAVQAMLFGLVALGPLVVLAALAFGVVEDRTYAGSQFHFAVVTTISAIVWLLAMLMRIAAGRLREPRAFFLSLAYLFVSWLFLIHALTTPGVLVQGNPWVGFTAGLSPMLGAFFLVLSTVRWSTDVREWIVNRQAHLTAGAAFGLVVISVVALITSWRQEYPAGLPEALVSATSGNVLVAATMMMLVYVIGRYIWLYRVSDSPLVAGILVSSIFLAQSQISIVFAPIWHLSWWLYHLLLLAGFAAALLTMAIQYRRAGNIQGTVGDMLLQDTIAQLQRGYTDVIVALMQAVEAKDPYTRGHTQRVSELSQLIAQDLGLSNEDQEILNQSAILHDIGKIGIPDAVLYKPGPLTSDEFELIKEHPERGYHFIRHVRSLRRQSEGVRYHHERLDGSGYPEGLSGDEIPLIARIIAVADVFDALTSDRPYRSAFNEAQAIDILLSERGTKLDAACVDALISALPIWRSRSRRLGESLLGTFAR
jgi:hypothetical protein